MDFAAGSVEKQPGDDGKRNKKMVQFHEISIREPCTHEAAISEKSLNNLI